MAAQAALDNDLVEAAAPEGLVILVDNIIRTAVQDSDGHVEATRIVVTMVHHLSTTAQLAAIQTQDAQAERDALQAQVDQLNDSLDALAPAPLAE